MGKLRANTIAVRRVRGLTIAAVTVAAAMVAITLLRDGEGLSVGDAAVATAVLALILLVGALIELVFRAVPEPVRPLVLAVTIIPLLAAFGSLGLPDSVIHYSGHQETAYELGDSVSVIVMLCAGVAASALAAGHGYRSRGVAAVTALALALTVTLRDLGARELSNDWCGVDTVATYGDGSLETTSDPPFSCTLVLPAKRFEGF